MQQPDLSRVLALGTISLVVLMVSAALAGDADLVVLRSGARPVTPFTALGVFGSALSLLLLSTTPCRKWSIVPAMATIGVGLLTSMSWAARWWPGVFDSPIMRVIDEVVGEVRTRPSMPAGVALVLLGLSLIWRSQSGEIRLRIADALALGAFGMAWISVIGGTLSTAVDSLVPRATMNLFAGGCIAAVAVGSLALRTDRGIASVFSSPYYGGKISRFLVPVALVLPIVLAVVAGGALPDGHLPKGRAATMFAFYCLTLAGVGMYLGHRCAIHDRQLRLAEREREKVIADLQRSLQEVRALETEFVRMCTWTQTIEDKGRWISFEEFLRHRLHVQVERAISPEGIKLLKNKQVPLVKTASSGRA
ncbi:MAG: hypothetical protein ACKV22_21685 [Bryobacteraceae bacterium]